MVSASLSRAPIGYNLELEGRIVVDYSSNLKWPLLKIGASNVQRRPTKEQDEHDGGDEAHHAAVAVGGLHALRPLQGQDGGRTRRLRHQHYGIQVSPKNISPAR